MTFEDACPVPLIRKGTEAVESRGHEIWSSNREVEMTFPAVPGKLP